MTMSADVGSLVKPVGTEPYTAKAGVNASGGVDAITGFDKSAVDKAAKDKAAATTKTDFLQLLVTQLRFQDPLSPMDNTQFVTQLAQFQQLESTNNMQQSIANLDKSYKETLDAQKSSAASLSNNSSVSMIGKEVRVKEKNVSWGGGIGEEVPILVNLGKAAKATVEIVDADGNVVRTLTTGGKAADNTASVAWDGLDDTGERVDPGAYEVKIEGEGSNSDLYAFVQNTVLGVRFGDQGAMLKVGGKELPASDIVDVATSQTASEFGGLSQESALTLLGKQVSVLKHVVTSNGRSDQNITFKVNMGGYQSTKIQILDSEGNVVDRIQVNPEDVTNGVATVTWNGRGSGQYMDALAAGEYRIDIPDSARNPNVYSYVDGTVDGVTASSSGLVVRVNGEYVPLSGIFEITNRDVKEAV